MRVVTAPPIVLIISIHAPAKGATALNDNWDKLDNISIHAPAKGATSGRH